MPNDAIHAPWSEAVVVTLNQHQHGVRHSYTCPSPMHQVASSPHLVATRGGWICSHAPDCDYTQDWAHLADVRFLDELRQSLETPMSPEEAAELPEEPPVELSLDDIAAMAYEAYSMASGGKAFNGDPLPAWEKVSPQIQSYWRAAMRVVRGPLSQPPRVGIVSPRGLTERCDCEE